MPDQGPHRGHQPYACQVVCPHCEHLNRIDWFLTRKNPEGGFAMACRDCGKGFVFKAWQYSAPCPGCGQEFIAKMSSTIGDNFDYQQQCSRCHGLMHFRRNRAPTWQSTRDRVTLVVDAGTPKRKSG